MVTYPNEIKDIGGEIRREVTTYQYELMEDGKLTKESTSTQTYFYLYTIDDNYYWNVRRSEYETSKSFYPQDLTLKIDNIIKSKTIEGKTSWICIDESTDEKWSIVILPWQNQKYGYFYALSKLDDDKSVIYSVHIKNTTVH